MAHVRIKICGITNRDDAHAAAMVGADAIGLNFYAPSPRFVQPEAVSAILRDLPPFVEPVGIFVGQRLKEIVETATPFGRLRTVQCYGDQHEAIDPFPFRVIPAFPVRDRESLQAVRSHLDACESARARPEAILLDAHAPGVHGGTGRRLPWELLADFQPAVPVILAGGLTPENVAEAIRIVRPYGVDVASGVESAPGKKDPAKMRRFIEAARAAAQSL